jgi:predicted DNA-binding transcriptional regulator YafY
MNRFGTERPAYPEHLSVRILTKDSFRKEHVHHLAIGLQALNASYPFRLIAKRAIDAVLALPLRHRLLSCVLGVGKGHAVTYHLNQLVKLIAKAKAIPITMKDAGKTRAWNVSLIWSPLLALLWKGQDD